LGSCLNFDAIKDQVSSKSSMLFLGIPRLVSVDGEDPDIAGMVPGPQKQAWELMDVLTDDEKLAIEEAEEEAKKKLEKEVAGA